MAGEPTMEKAKNSIAFRFIDTVRVPGILDEAPPLKIYQILDTESGRSDEKKPLLALFEKAITAYGAGRFDEAFPLFEQCAREFNDTPSKVYAERTKKLCTDPPAFWDAVWRIDSK
jgi:hypothetical protein